MPVIRNLSFSNTTQIFLFSCIGDQICRLLTAFIHRPKKSARAGVLRRKKILKRISASTGNTGQNVQHYIVSASLGSFRASSHRLVRRLIRIRIRKICYAVPHKSSTRRATLPIIHIFGQCVPGPLSFPANLLLSNDLYSHLKTTKNYEGKEKK